MFGFKFLRGDLTFEEAKRQCEITPGGYLTRADRYRSSLLRFMTSLKRQKYGETPLYRDAYIGELLCTDSIKMSS